MSQAADWFESHQLTCQVKEATGMECPGCGIQRSIVALLRGDIVESFLMYPALIPLIITILLLIIYLVTQRDWSAKWMLRSVYLTLILIGINYGKTVVLHLMEHS